jgi:hypothetical protein
MSKVLRSLGPKYDYAFAGKADVIYLNLSFAVKNAKDNPKKKILPTNPGLQIQNKQGDWVDLTFPLDNDNAKTLVDCFQKAPFGKDQETLYDDSVRKTWQISPDKVKITNPQWETAFEKLESQIKDRLRVGKFNAKISLYKFLMYGPGGHFLPHQDTEKEKGMFAT